MDAYVMYAHMFYLILVIGYPMSWPLLCYSRKLTPYIVIIFRGTSVIKGFAKLYDYVLNDRLGTSHSGSRQEANLKDVVLNLSHKEGLNCTSLL